MVVVEGPTEDQGPGSVGGVCSPSFKMLISFLVRVFVEVTGDDNFAIFSLDAHIQGRWEGDGGEEDVLTHKLPDYWVEIAPDGDHHSER